MVDSAAPQNHLRRLYVAMKVLKEKREVMTVNLWDEGSESYPLLHTASMLSCSLLDAVLFTQFGYTVYSRGDWMERLGGDLVICHLLTLHFYLIYEKNWQVRQGIWKVCLGWWWVEYGGAWFKSSLHIALQKWQEIKLPTESGLLQRAAYKYPLFRTSFSFYGIMCEGLSSVTSSCWHRVPYSQSVRCQPESVAALPYNYSFSLT